MTYRTLAQAQPRGRDELGESARNPTEWRLPRAMSVRCASCGTRNLSRVRSRSAGSRRPAGAGPPGSAR
ncbi:MAG: hypothetical protein E6J56_06680 [Deltaproteobacteria bacterium]|nr:MAG: hypothetical protein E6J56_06680 [Deltaproteobacteria bacterium]